MPRSMDITCAPSDSDSTSLQTPRTLTIPHPSYQTPSKARDHPYWPPPPASLESDIADYLHLVTTPYTPTRPLIPPKGPNGPHTTSLPYRHACTPPTLPAPVATQQQDECRCLHEVVPGLFVAFADDRLAFRDAPAPVPSERLQTHKGAPFTHIVTLATQHAKHGEGPAAHLRLVLPAAPDVPDDDGDDDDDYAHPSLSGAQLIAARDFLFKSNLRLSATTMTPAQRADTRILITTPRDRRADALAVAACYLASASGLAVGRVMAHFDAGEGLGAEVWQDIMDWRAWDFVEDMARR